MQDSGDILKMINFSIIIPHYNIPDLLMRCLRSIPVREDIQVIVVDDCSPDASRYLEDYSELSRPYLEFYTTPKGGSAGRARNVGLEHAKGKWLIFADADDFFTEEFDSTLDFYKDSDWDVIMFPIRTVDSLTLEPSSRDPFFNETINNIEFSERRILAENITPWSKLIKHELITKHSIFHGETPVSNDVIFNTKIAIYANKIKIDREKTIYVLTRNAGSLCTRNQDEMIYVRICVEMERKKLWKYSGYDELRDMFVVYGFFEQIKSVRYWLKSLFVYIVNGEVFLHSPYETYYRCKFLLRCLKKIIYNN